MVKPHLSLVVLVYLAGAAAASAQTSYVFQLPGSAQTGVPPQITGVGDNDASRMVTSASTTALAGASKVVATPNGTKFYVLTANGVLSANSTLSGLSPLSAIAGRASDEQVTPDGRYLFVVSSQLYIVNTTTDALAANANTGIPPGATPVAVAFSHDSKTAWILSNTNTGSTITTVNLATLQSGSTQLTLSDQATFMVLSPGDLLYVATNAARIYEINPVALAVTTLGQIDLPGTGVPGPLQFTPDGANAYFVNTIACSTCSPFFQLNIQTHAISTWLPSNGSAPPFVDQVLVAGNSRVFGWSSALTQLWDITPSPLALAPTVIGLLPTSSVLAAAVSNEIPSSRFLYLLFPDLSFDRITLANNDAAQSSRLNLINGSLLQFVPIPAQSNTAIQPLSLSLINSSQSLAPSATAVLTGQLVDSAGRPVLGAPAVFSADPGIAITNSSVTTTAGGWAETTAIVPAAPGNYSATLCSPSCNSGGVSSSFALTVSNTVSGGGGTSPMTIYAGDGELLTQNESTAQMNVPLTVQIADASGNPVAGTPVTFQLNTGAIGFLPGALNNPTYTTTTDENGLARADYVSATIPTNQSVYPSTIHASSAYGAVDFYELTYVNSIANSSEGPYSQPLTPRTISVPQGGILPLGIQTQTFTGSNQPVANVGLRLIDDPTNPTPNSTVASCVGPSRADNNGISSCNVLAICQPNITPPHDFPVILEVGEILPFRFVIHMTQGVASVLQPASSLTQAGNPGSFFTLAAQVKDGCGLPIATSGLTWGILTGSSPAQLVNPSTSSDSSGSVTTGVTLGQTAGVVQIQLSGAGLTPIIFKITNQIIITSLSAVPPLPPAVTVGQQFQPLTFVVGNASNNPVAGVLVNFSASGGVTLSTSSATTNQQGMVQVTVTAGFTPGTILVTATAAGLSYTATLTAHAAGPTLTTNSFTNAASGALGLTPCGFVTVTGNGVASGAQGVVPALTFFGAYPYSLAGLSITVNGTLVPIQAVANDQFGQRANFQAPCELTGSSATVVVTVNGASTTIPNVPVLLVQPGIFTYTGSNNKLYGAVIRAVDGTYVTATNPARQGEKVYVVVTGLGQATPTLITNSVGTGSQNVNLPTAVFLSGRGVPGISAQYLFGWVGAYLVEFQVPPDSATGPDQTLAVVETSADGSNFLGVSNTVLMPAVSIP
jgi:uncharacterized protein (TIGR03437 family)